MVDAVPLVKGVRGEVPAAVDEFGRQDAGHADRLFPHPIAFVQDAEMVAGLDAAEVDGPRVHLGHGEGKRGGVPLVFEHLVEASLHLSFHESAAGFRRELVAPGGAVVDEVEDHVFLAVDEVDEVGSRALCIAEQAPFLAGFHAAHIEDLTLLRGDVVQGLCANARRGKEVGQALARLDLALLDAESEGIGQPETKPFDLIGGQPPHLRTTACLRACPRHGHDIGPLNGIATP